MNKEIINRIKQGWPRAALLFAVLAAGLLLGKACAGCTMRSALFEGGRFPFLLYRPAVELYAVYLSLNNSDPAKRLGGYYAMRDYGILDEGFLRERYEMEESEVIRRTIIWLMGQSSQGRTALKFYRRVYPAASPRVRKAILANVERMGQRTHADFLADQEKEKDRGRKGR